MFFLSLPPKISPLNIWFDYCLHKIPQSVSLKSCPDQTGQLFNNWTDIKILIDVQVKKHNTSSRFH